MSNPPHKCANRHDHVLAAKNNHLGPQRHGPTTPISCTWPVPKSPHWGFGLYAYLLWKLFICFVTSMYFAFGELSLYFAIPHTVSNLMMYLWVFCSVNNKYTCIPRGFCWILILQIWESHQNLSVWAVIWFLLTASAFFFFFFFLKICKLKNLWLWFFEVFQNQRTPLVLVLRTKELTVFMKYAAQNWKYCRRLFDSQLDILRTVFVYQNVG